MVVAFDGPIGDDDEHFRAELRSGPEVLREAEVVADQRGDPEPRPLEEDDLPSRRMHGRLAAEGEGLELHVPGQDVAGGGEGERLVRRAAVLIGRYQSPDHGAAESPREVGKESLGCIRVAHRPRRVEAEAGERGLGEDDEIAGRRCHGVHQIPHPAAIGGRILPGDVELHEVDVHDGANPLARRQPRIASIGVPWSMARRRRPGISSRWESRPNCFRIVAWMSVT